MLDTIGRWIALALVLTLRLAFRDIDQIEWTARILAYSSALAWGYRVLAYVSVFLACAASTPQRTGLSKWIWGSVAIELLLAAARVALISEVAA